MIILTFRSTVCGFLALLLAGCGAGISPSDPTRGANKYLWNASLDSFAALPIEFVDPHAGVIQTGWGRVAGSSQIYRARVTISDAALDAASLDVAVFRRSGAGAIPATLETVSAVENAILSRARQLRIMAVRG